MDKQIAKRGAAHQASLAAAAAAVVVVFVIVDALHIDTLERHLPFARALSAPSQQPCLRVLPRQSGDEREIQPLPPS